MRSEEAAEQEAAEENLENGAEGTNFAETKNTENNGTDETISTTERNDGQAIQPMERGTEQGNSLLELAEGVLTGRGRGYDTQSQRGVRSENGGRETDFDGERQEAAVEELAKELGVCLVCQPEYRPR